MIKLEELKGKTIVILCPHHKQAETLIAAAVKAGWEESWVEEGNRYVMLCSDGGIATFYKYTGNVQILLLSDITL